MKKIEYRKSRQAIGLISPIAAAALCQHLLSTLLPGCQLSKARTAHRPPTQDYNV